MAVDEASGLTRLVVAGAEDGLRIDQFVATVTNLSRRRSRALIDGGSVWLNGAALRVQSRQVQIGDVVDVLRSPQDLGDPEAARPARPVSLLFADGWIAVAHKPAGVLSQPAESSGPDDPCLEHLLLAQIARAEGRRPFLRLVHRLDRVTSGTLVFARRPQALPLLTRAWAAGDVERTYLAVVAGRPRFTTIELDQPIARDRRHHWRFCVHPSGRQARTAVRVIHHAGADATVVACRLLTGRTHQVRVHLAAAGVPVLGDILYGSRRPPTVSRPLLHAATVALPHPRDGKLLRVDSAPPEDMTPFLPAGFDVSSLHGQDHDDR